LSTHGLDIQIFLMVNARSQRIVTTSVGTIEIINNLTLGNPFYQAKIGKVVGQSVLGTSEGFSQVEQSTSKMRYKRRWKSYKPSDVG